MGYREMGNGAAAFEAKHTGAEAANGKSDAIQIDAFVGAVKIMLCHESSRQQDAQGKKPTFHVGAFEVFNNCFIAIEVALTSLLSGGLLKYFPDTR